ncbi:MAG: hypothetical protein ACREFI_16745, partial [Stellaceae bacterium]
MIDVAFVDPKESQYIDLMHGESRFSDPNSHPPMGQHLDLQNREFGEKLAQYGNVVESVYERGYRISGGSL